MGLVPQERNRSPELNFFYLWGSKEKKKKSGWTPNKQPTCPHLISFIYGVSCENKRNEWQLVLT